MTQEALHAFAFQTGSWRVRHRKLKQRLAGSNEWIEFGGMCEARELLGGAGNVDDFMIDEPGGSWRAATFRRLDPTTGVWSIWWADARRGGLDAPLQGKFENGVGTFFGKDTHEGKPVLLRFIWSEITATHARWEQAFSPDDGKTWEVNWIMNFDRIESLETT